MVFILFTIYYLPYTNPIFADTVKPGQACRIGQDTCDTSTGSFQCIEYPPGSNVHLCLESPIASTFGKITPPDPLKKFIGSDPSGAGGLSRFFTNLVSLFYSVAAVVLIFMLIWGAWDWLTSEGDKEKLESAKRKLINAFVGIMIFAVAFAVIQVLGNFTGFKFFTGQK